MLRHVRQLLRVAFSRHRFEAGVAVVAVWLGAALGSSVMPKTYLAVGEVLMNEPSTVYRLASPFDAVPRLREGLASLPEELTSKARLVAVVKQTALVDRWDALRPWPARLKAAVLERVREPPSEADRLDALVGLLEKQLSVELMRNTLVVTCRLPDRRLAAEVVARTLDALGPLRSERDVQALETAAAALEEQRAGVEAELKRRLELIEAEQRQARAAGRQPDTSAAMAQLLRDASRRDELLVQASDAKLRAQAMGRSARLRYVVTRPPLVPRRAEGPSVLERSLAVTVVSLVLLVAGALLASLRSGRVTWGPRLERLGVPVVARVRVGWSGLMVSPTVATVWPGAALGLCSGLALGLSRGQLAAGLAPGLVLALGVALVRLPLKWPLLGLLLLAVTIDDPTDRPYVGLWHSPLTGVGRLFFTNIAWFTGFEFAVMGLAALAVIKRVWAQGAPNIAHGEPGPAPLRSALLVSFGTVVWLIALGLLRGGDFREALWQFRALLFMPVVAALALAAFEVPKDLKKLGFVLVVGSVVKAVLGTYFMYAVAFPQGEYPPHTTGHNDTMIFAVGVVLALTRIWERPTWRRLGEALLWLPILAMALRLNDRRIAYVDIAFALGFIFVVSPMHRMKRFLTRAAVASIPVLVLYTAVGWNARGGVFKPVAKIRSIVAPAADTEEESSNAERDIENFNLIKSWERNTVFGQGFGHAFTEFVPSNDFAQSNFGHIGHNSVLWLLWIGGILGFFGVWLYVGVACFFFARALPHAASPLERVGLFTAAAVLITYLLQSFGDMGTQAMQFVFIVSAALAVIGRTASRHGVWRRAPTGPRSIDEMSFNSRT